jgi:regulatory subunit for Cdc7p protein kinase
LSTIYHHVRRLLEAAERVITVAFPYPTPSLLHTEGKSCSLLLRMAAVSISLSPQVLTEMTNRRVPLATVPNATNSPYRAVTAAAAKRQRAHAADQRELEYGQPPTKKQLVDFGATRRAAASQPTAFQRKLESARDSRLAQIQRQSEQAQKTKNQEHLRQWREHYKKEFPTFVFYFEGIPEDARPKILKSIRILGAVRWLITYFIF